MSFLAPCCASYIIPGNLSNDLCQKNTEKKAGGDLTVTNSHLTVIHCTVTTCMYGGEAGQKMSE